MSTEGNVIKLLEDNGFMKVMDYRDNNYLPHGVSAIARPYILNPRDWG